jgi:hypothetical protein
MSMGSPSIDTSEAACHNEDYGGTRLEVQLALVRACATPPAAGGIDGRVPPGGSASLHVAEIATITATRAPRQRVAENASGSLQGCHTPSATSMWALVSVGQTAQVVLPPTESAAAVAAAIAGLKPRGEACNFLAGLKLARVWIPAGKTVDATCKCKLHSTQWAT